MFLLSLFFNCTITDKQPHLGLRTENLLENSGSQPHFCRVCSIGRFTTVNCCDTRVNCFVSTVKGCVFMVNCCVSTVNCGTKISIFESYIIYDL